jgi:purine-binding chemotaxis protein CheW
MNMAVASSSSASKEVNKKNVFGGGLTAAKFLTFVLAKEEYGFEILKAQEIIGLMPITQIPGTPEYICGIINLRGKVIPVMDLRIKFGMPAAERTAETCIIVMRIQQREMGIIVDKVSEVLNIKGGDVEAVPDFGVGVDTDYILGIGKTEGKVKILLDADKVLTPKELNEAVLTTAEP